MAATLPRLRMNLDFLPSPAPDRPGLLIRDPLRYSDATLIVPPPLVACLEFYDGEKTSLDLREMLVRLTGDLQVGEIERHLTETLSQAGFLDDDSYLRLREERRREFAAAPRREPALAGGAYPASAPELRLLLDGYVPGGAAGGGLIGLAAPHISLEGGWETYQAAYRTLGGDDGERVCVVLGTSHHGEPDRFGLTRKPYSTPYGDTRTGTPIVERLEREGGDAVAVEDYCHAIEHSIEFQVLFLQHVMGPQVCIVPILCGSFVRGLMAGREPEADERVRRFLGVLGELNAREGRRLLWVLGIDMAHMGRRYGDPFPVTAGQGRMAEVAVRDAARIGRVGAGDPEGFWNLVQENQDDLKWCGTSPLYTFLRAVPEARGALLRYQQWNIDPQSAVSFAAMEFQPV